MTETARGLTGLDAEMLACVGLTSAAGAAERKPFALPGDRPVWGRDRPLDIEHVRLELSFDVPRQRLSGVATTTFWPRQDGLREAVFDAYELDIQAVRDADGRDLPYTYSDGKLRIDLGGEVPAETSITTEVHYSTRPRRGIYFNRPDPGYPSRPDQIWSQGQPEDAPYWFPCFDYPGEKATVELIAEVPAGWFALSNGRLESVNEDGRRRRSTYHWVQEVPVPAYLVTITAGEFDVVEDSADGVPVQYYGPRGSADDLKRAFGRTPEMVTFFSEKIGVPYPYEKYATVAIHDFTWGGMENTSATTMTDTLLHDDRAHEDFVEAADGITAHELAHQWFGDLLTCREWSHGWLHESFATYFDALWVEHARGWDDFRNEMRENAKAYLAEDSSAYRRPLVEHTYRGPIDIFDRHLYERGSLVLDMLRWLLGDVAWWRTINHYVATYAGRDVVTHEFQRAIEAATGRNLDWFFDQWVWKGGHPEFKAAYAWDGEHRLATIKLSQQQKADGHLTSIYRTPLDIVAVTAEGPQRFRVEVSEAEHSFVLPLDGEPRFIAIDPANRVLKTLEFEPGEAQLKARLTDDTEAMGRIEAARGLGKIASPAAIDALRAVLENADELPYVRVEIAAALGETKAGAAREALVANVATEPARVRRGVATTLGQFRHDEAAVALESLLARDGDRSYYVQSSAAAALGATRRPIAFDALNRVLGRPSHNDVITSAALGGLAALRDPQAVEVLLEWTDWGRPQGPRRAATEALGRLAPFAEEPVRLRVRERLEELLDDPQLRVQVAATDALASLGDARAAGALGGIQNRTLEGRLTRAARVAARALGEKSDKGEEVKALRGDLDELQQENQRLKDRLTKLEALTGAAAPEPKADARSTRGTKATGRPGSTKRGASKAAAEEGSSSQGSAATPASRTNEAAPTPRGTRTSGRGASGSERRR